MDAFDALVKKAKSEYIANLKNANDAIKGNACKDLVGDHESYKLSNYLTDASVKRIEWLSLFENQDGSEKFKEKYNAPLYSKGAMTLWCISFVLFFPFSLIIYMHLRRNRAIERMNKAEERVNISCCLTCQHIEERIDKEANEIKANPPKDEKEDKKDDDKEELDQKSRGEEKYNVKEAVGGLGITASPLLHEGAKPMNHTIPPNNINYQSSPGPQAVGVIAASKASEPGNGPPPSSS